MSKARRRLPPSVEFTNQEQLRELLEAIEEKDRLIALLSGCIESPEPVHVELGLDKMSGAGKHLALVSASYSSNDQVQGTLGNSGADAHALRARDHRRGFHGAVFFRTNRGELIPCLPTTITDKEQAAPKLESPAGPKRTAATRIPSPMPPSQAGSAADHSRMQKLLAEKQELMNTLVRRQADFENYRKRVEKERHQDRHRGVELLIEQHSSRARCVRSRARRRRTMRRQRRISQGIRTDSPAALGRACEAGLVRIESVGKEFNPHFHHAIEQRGDVRASRKAS